MSNIFSQNKKITIFILVLLAIIIIMNLITLNIIPFVEEIFLLMIIILIIWLSIGLAIFLRWTRLTFRKVDLQFS